MQILIIPLWILKQWYFIKLKIKGGEIKLSNKKRNRLDDKILHTNKSVNIKNSLDSIMSAYKDDDEKEIK